MTNTEETNRYELLRRELTEKLLLSSLYSPEECEKVAEGLVHVMEEVIMEAHTGQIRPESHMRDGVGFDSLCVRELHLGIEEYFNIELNEKTFFDKIYRGSEQKPFDPTVLQLATNLVSYIYGGNRNE